MSTKSGELQFVQKNIGNLFIDISRDFIKFSTAVCGVMMRIFESIELGELTFHQWKEKE